MDVHCTHPTTVHHCTPLYTGGQWRLVATSPLPAGNSHTVPDCQERKLGSRRVCVKTPQYSSPLLSSPQSSLASDYLLKFTTMEIKRKIKKKVTFLTYEINPTLLAEEYFLILLQKC